MRKWIGLPVVAFLIAGCGAEPVSPPMSSLSVRSAVIERLPEGTEVFLSLNEDPSTIVGSTFMVQGTGNLQSAYCLGFNFPNNAPLYLHHLTLVGGGPNPETQQNVVDTFSTPMPPGTKIRILGVYGPTYCVGTLVFRAVVVNGS